MSVVLSTIEQTTKEQHIYFYIQIKPAALCGMSGFDDFLSEAPLKAILSWQDEKEGCWKSNNKKGGSES